MRAAFVIVVSPAFLDLIAALGVFASVFVQAAHLGFEPRIKDRDAHPLEKLAHAIAPAGLFLRRARGDEIHRAGKIDARTLQQRMFIF